MVKRFRGGALESLTTRQHLYAFQGRNIKYIPVVFAEQDIAYIPPPLRGYTYYKLLKEYEPLYRFLTDQPIQLQPPLGKIRSLTSTTSALPESPSITVASPLPIEDVTSDYEQTFSPSIQAHMSTLQQVVDRLTKDQFRIIRLLAGSRHVRISGSSGSGKTLVAAEKAIRLSFAGIRTLFLCHNPMLADRVRSLTRGSGVQVESFSSWVGKLSGKESSERRRFWSNYYEPTEHDIDKAFDALVSSEDKVEAVIVDEAQDFRTEWWTLVEAAQGETHSGILYLFHDDAQALLPYRSQYPINKPTYDLSKNCRNAGEVYEVMRCFDTTAPAVEPELEGIGSAQIFPYSLSDESVAVENAMRYILSLGCENDLVALVAGGQDVKTSPLAGMAVEISNIHGWQDEVRRQFHRATNSSLHSGSRCPPIGEEAVQKQLRGLSGNSVPNPRDIELVRNLALSFEIGPLVRRRILDHPAFRHAVKWQVEGNILRLRRPGQASIWPEEILMHFQRPDWDKGMPPPISKIFCPAYQITDKDDIPIYNVSAFKGLESEAILLFTKARSPMLTQEIYVGISRARFVLALVIDDPYAPVLPNAWRSNIGTLIK